jgi:hypothetical protein
MVRMGITNPDCPCALYRTSDLGMRMHKTWSCPLLVRLGSAAPVQTTQAPSASAPAPCSACGDQVFLELLSITPLELRLVFSTFLGATCARAFGVNWHLACPIQWLDSKTCCGILLTGSTETA